MSAAVILVALGIDLALGDPPNRWHPVAWAGSAIAHGSRRVPAGRPALLLAWGGVLVVGVALLAALAAAAAVWAAGAAQAGGAWPVFPLVVEAAVLKGAFALRGLFAATRGVLAALAADDLPAARARVGRDLVSRPTGDLDAGLVRAAAIESLAENLTDSWVAPLCWYAVGGVAGAWAYRVVNTADALVGYRGGRFEYLGKVAARLDDAMSWIPARLAAAAIVLAAPLAGSARGAWRALRADARRPASPNAGWTMAAMAGALGVRLEKRGHYRLGEGPAPGAAAGCRALRIAAGAATLTGLAAVAQASLR